MTDDDLDIRLQWTLPSHLAHLADDINPIVQSVAQEAADVVGKANAEQWIKLILFVLTESDFALPADGARNIERLLREAVGLQQRPVLRLVIDNASGPTSPS